ASSRGTKKWSAASRFAPRSCRSSNGSSFSPPSSRSTPTPARAPRTSSLGSTGAIGSAAGPLSRLQLDVLPRPLAKLQAHRDRRQDGVDARGQPYPEQTQVQHHAEKVGA